MKILLGVIDQPYQNATSKVATPKKGKANAPAKVKVSADQVTTGDVAEWLEKKYNVMQGFVDLHQRDIAHSLENSLAGALESLMHGAPVRNDVFGTAMGEIETLFKFTYLDKEEIVQTGAEGVPTEAAKKGVSPRFKNGKGPRRPSFIASGLYQTSFKSWVE